VFGAEKNKLVIQPLGVVCIECLVEVFADLFDYGYTNTMEAELDKIEYAVNGDSGIDRSTRSVREDAGRYQESADGDKEH
jgi:DNA topoisomerase IA